MLNLTSEKTKGVLVVRVSSRRIDAHGAPTLKHELAPRISRGENSVVLDLSLVEFIDSVGLGAVVSLLKAVGRSGRLAIVGAKGAVKRLFSLTRMDRVFPMYDTLEEALSPRPS